MSKILLSSIYAKFNLNDKIDGNNEEVNKDDRPENIFRHISLNINGYPYDKIKFLKSFNKIKISDHILNYSLKSYHLIIRSIYWLLALQNKIIHMYTLNKN